MNWKVLKKLQEVQDNYFQLIEEEKSRDSKDGLEIDSKVNELDQNIQSNKVIDKKQEQTTTSDSTLWWTQGLNSTDFFWKKLNSLLKQGDLLSMKREEADFVLASAEKTLNSLKITLEGDSSTSISEILMKNLKSMMELPPSQNPSEETNKELEEVNGIAIYFLIALLTISTKNDTEEKMKKMSNDLQTEIQLKNNLEEKVKVLEKEKDETISKTEIAIKNLTDKL